MTIRALEGTIDGREVAALINVTTGVMLPCHTFRDVGEAEDFVAWVRRKGWDPQKVNRTALTGLWERWHTERKPALATADTVPDTRRSRRGWSEPLERKPQ